MTCELEVADKVGLLLQYDRDAIGAIPYRDLMKDLLDKDSYALFCGRDDR